MNPLLSFFSAAPAAKVAPAGPRADFPDWLPAMLVKELRQALRTKGFVSVFIGFHVIAILAFWWSIELNVASGLRDTYSSLNTVFWGLLDVLLLLVVPWRGLGALRVEMDSRTIDLLVLTRLTGWRIVLGKWGSLVAQAALVLIAFLPYGVARYFFGSVDLASDFEVIGRFALLSVTLAAAALWISTLPKLLRVLLPIAAVLVLMNFGVNQVFGIFGGLRGTMPVAGPRTMFAGMGETGHLACACAVLVPAFLGLAVRRLAPRAENHSQIARGFGLLLVAILIAAAAVRLVDEQLAAVISFVVILMMCALEMAQDCLPLNAHWMPWKKRGATGALLGRMALPGWPSAVFYAAATLALFAVMACLLKDWRPVAESLRSSLWLLVLAWQALVFPALLLSFLPATSSLRMGGSGYFVIQALFGTISLVTASNSAAYFVNYDFAGALEVVCRVLPVSSFWLAAPLLKQGFTLDFVLGQLAVLIAIVALVRRQSRPYWAQVARFSTALKAKPAVVGTE